MSFNGEQFEFFKPKNQKIQSSYGEQNKRTTRPWRQNLNMNHVIRKKLTEANLKKAFRIKLFELCKTRTKKSSPDPINFYVISARHDMAIDAGRATRCKWQFKAPWLQTERTKNEEPSEKLSFNGEQFEIFKPKKPKTPIILRRTKQKNHKTLKEKIEPEPMHARGNRLKQKLKKHSEWNCLKSARLEIRSQVLTWSSFM